MQVMLTLFVQEATCSCKKVLDASSNIVWQVSFSNPLTRMFFVLSRQTFGGSCFGRTTTQQCSCPCHIWYRQYLQHFQSVSWNGPLSNIPPFRLRIQETVEHSGLDQGCFPLLFQIQHRWVWGIPVLLHEVWHHYPTFLGFGKNCSSIFLPPHPFISVEYWLVMVNDH